MSYMSYGKRDWLKWLYQLGGGRLVREESVKDHRFMQYEMLMEFFPDWDAVTEAFNVAYPKTDSANQASQTAPPQTTAKVKKSTTQTKQTAQPKKAGAGTSARPKQSAVQSNQAGAGTAVQSKSAGVGASVQSKPTGADKRDWPRPSRKKQTRTKADCVAFLRRLYAELGAIPTNLELDHYAIMWDEPRYITMSRMLGPKDRWVLYLIDDSGQNVQDGQKVQSEPAVQSESKVQSGQSVQSGQRVQSGSEAQSEPKVQSGQTARETQVAEKVQVSQANGKVQPDREAQSAQKGQPTQERNSAQETALSADLPNLSEMSDEARKCVIFLRRVYVELGEVPTLPDIGRYAELWGGPSYGTIRSNLGGRNDWQKYLTEVGNAEQYDDMLVALPEENDPEADTPKEVELEADPPERDKSEVAKLDGSGQEQGDKSYKLVRKQACIDFLKRLYAELGRMPSRADIEYYGPLWHCPIYNTMINYLGPKKEWPQYLGEGEATILTRKDGERSKEECLEFLKRLCNELNRMPMVKDVDHYAPLWDAPCYSTMKARLGGVKEWPQYLPQLGVELPQEACEELASGSGETLKATESEEQASGSKEQVCGEAEAVEPEQYDAEVSKTDVDPALTDKPRRKRQPRRTRTKQECIDFLIRLVTELKRMPNQSEFIHYASLWNGPSYSTMVNRLGTMKKWRRHLGEFGAELPDAPDGRFGAVRTDAEPEKPALGWHGRQPYKMRTKEECIDFLRELAAKFGRIPSSTEVTQYAKLWRRPSYAAMLGHLGPKDKWSQYLREEDKNLPTEKIHSWPKEECLDFLKRLCTELQRIPTMVEVDRYSSLWDGPCYATMLDRLGGIKGWYRYLDELGIELPEDALGPWWPKERCVSFLRRVYAEVGGMPTKADIERCSSLWNGPSYITLTNHIGGKKQWDQYLSEPEDKE